MRDACPFETGFKEEAEQWVFLEKELARSRQGEPQFQFRPGE
jgi:hypothetical protein